MPEPETLPPGLALDRLIAERVMGLHIVVVEEECSQFTPDARWVPGGEYYVLDVLYAMAPGRAALDEPDDGDLVLSYSRDTAAAWLVVERMRGLGWVGELNWHNLNRPTTYYARFWRDGNGREGYAYAMTAPHALCVAALRALEATTNV